MKKGYIISAVLGGTFFAVPYLALSLPLIPSVAIAATAYGAGYLIFREKKETSNLDISFDSSNLYDILKRAKESVGELRKLSNEIDNIEIQTTIKEVCQTSNSIIDTISKNPEKLKQIHNFLNYYLPVTIKILKRYEEIEENKLDNKEAKEFMKSISEMMEKIEKAFKEQLANLYQTDMIDTDAEIKVFESMLKSDGFMSDDDLKL